MNIRVFLALLQDNRNVMRASSGIGQERQPTGGGSYFQWRLDASLSLSALERVTIGRFFLAMAAAAVVAP